MLFERWLYVNRTTLARKIVRTAVNRDVASLTVSGGQEFHFPHFSSNSFHFSFNFPHFCPHFDFGPPGERAGILWLYTTAVNYPKHSSCMSCDGRATSCKHILLHQNCKKLAATHHRPTIDHLTINKLVNTCIVPHGRLYVLRAVERVTLIRFLFGMHPYKLTLDFAFFILEKAIVKRI